LRRRPPADPVEKRRRDPTSGVKRAILKTVPGINAATTFIEE
jgi:hypothetical protein